MRRQLFAAVAGVALLWAGVGCGGGSTSLGPEARDACREYQRVLNEWGSGYGAELGAVGQAVAAGDQARQETAVEVVRQLYRDAAAQLREQAERASHGELTQALTGAADGLEELAAGIETYEDVTAAPERMSRGRFAERGERVSALCTDA